MKRGNIKMISGLSIRRVSHCLKKEIGFLNQIFYYYLHHIVNFFDYLSNYLSKAMIYVFILKIYSIIANFK